MSSSDFYLQSFKIRESELRRAAEQHRLVVEAERGAAEAASESDGNQDRKGGRSQFHFRGVRRSRRASAPSAC
ncbi:hypothetical protein EDD99_2499 [Streptomyces sp. 846.5]|nr:hypothetical protein [Streptomyces sp. 846.5]TDU04045.1 hypothetical protein EDD99_2499 [Streptomyces sp. 846.5]